jgi:AbiV family abortive infection protein
MIPSKKTLGKLKAEIHINAVRLFVDGCGLFKNRSHASAFAFAILSFEELGKLEMVDHICDDISINPHCDAQDFLEHLFSRPMFFSHRNKQMWASSPIFNSKKKRIKEISEGVLDRAKQDALYVGYFNRRIRSPRRITPQKAYDELTIVFRKFADVADLGLNGFDCWSNAQSRMKAKRLLAKVEKAYSSLKKGKRKP